MKTALYITFLLFITTGCLAQEGWTRQDKRDYADGDFAFFQEDYELAFEIFETLYAKDSTYAPLCYRMGTCMVQLRKDRQKALSLLQLSVENGIDEAYFYLGRALHLVHRFDESIEAYGQYKQLEEKEIQNYEVDRFIEVSKRAKRLVATPVDVAISNLGPGVNTENLEYGPVVSNNTKTMYFTSRRSNTTAQLKDPSGQYFEDIYYSQLADGKWSQAENLGTPVNSETHDATVSITTDGNTMIIYRTNKDLIGGDLYMCHRRGDKWSEPKILDRRINSPYQEASASLSNDGNTLYFSSDRPGGFGGKDIYRVRMLPNGEWSLPKNLGPMINTAGDEDGPFIDIDEKTLYFSSTGLGTMGGYDVFRSTYLGDERWSAPENLGYPVNTVEDDIYLAMDPGGRSAYYSSDKEGGFGQLDIYRVDFIDRMNELLVVKGEIIDLMEQPIKAKITLLDQSSRQVHGIYNTNEATGKFIMVLNPLVEYKAFIEADGFVPLQDEFLFPFPEEGNLEQVIAPYILINDQ